MPPLPRDFIEGCLQLEINRDSTINFKMFKICCIGVVNVMMMIDVSNDLQR